MGSTADGKPYLMYQLGTNNWQREGEYAPGSGVLHQSHHQVFNEFENVKCYSIYPSQNQTPHEDPQVEVFKLSHPIPICESASPVSSYRWHTMSDAEFQAYRARLEESVYNQMAAAEEKEGTTFKLAIAHHCFLNPMVLRNVLKRRVSEGKPHCALVVFAHGTALKMHKHEIGGANQEEYPMRFFKMMQEEHVFDSHQGSAVELVFAISQQQIDVVAEVFPEYDKKRVVVSPNGINQTIFHKLTDMSLTQVLETLETMPYEGSKVKSVVVDTVKAPKFDKLVLFVGKFADWKRLDALLKAAAEYEQDPAMANTVTLIVGSGPLDAQKLYQGLAVDLGLKRVFFVGPRPQPVLAQLYSVASVCVFPSKNEPFGMVFVEAMSCGAPVIGAASGGPLDFISPEVGELVPEADSTDELSVSLIDAILRSIKEDWRSSKESACMTLVDTKYSAKGQCTDLLANAKRMLKQ